MQRMRTIVVVVACLVGAVGVVAPLRAALSVPGVSAAAPKQRQYRCTKCREIHTFDRPGNYKCPKCGKNLIPVT